MHTNIETYTQTHTQTKVYLQAKELLENHFTNCTARYLLLHKCLSAPLFLEQGIKELYKEGALTENSDSGQVSAFGRFALAMPCDLQLSKLVMYGFLFQCVNDCIVMSSGLACFSSADLFWYPSAYVIRSNFHLVTGLSKSLHARTVYDRGYYSEPIMYLTVYKDWLKAANTANSNWSHKEWCDERSIYPSRMANFNLEV